MALAQAPATQLIAPLPKASAISDPNHFDSRQKALSQRAAENDYRYAVARHDCYSKFFVNRCLNQARKQMRSVDAEISNAQRLLDDEMRQAHAQQRDERIAAKLAQDAAAAPQRAAEIAANVAAYEEKQRQHALQQAQRNAAAPQRAANERAYLQKQADYQHKLEEAHKQAAQKAQQRTQNEQRYAEKQRNAAQHQAEVKARQQRAAEKERQNKLSGEGGR